MIMKNFLKPFLKLICLIFTINTFLIGCGGGGGSSEESNIRIIHASANAPRLDIYVNEDQIAQNIQYLDNTDYYSVKSGLNNLKITPHNSIQNLINLNVPLQNSTSYTILVSNNLAKIQPLVLVDSLEEPASGQAKIRVVDASPTAPQLSVQFVPIDLGEQSPSLGKTISGLNFNDVSDFNLIPNGRYNVNLVLKGASTPAYQIKDFNFSGKDVFTIVVFDANGGGSPFQLKAFEDRR